MNSKTLVPSPLKPEESCPQCDSRKLRQRLEKETFKYGSGPEAVSLSADVIVLECLECELEFTDHRAEDARHEAVCRHLRVLTPTDIKSIRAGLDMSRVEFARLTGIGSASLARWETGQLIQNSTGDNLLYLLRWRENIERLEQRTSLDGSARLSKEHGPIDIAHFVNLTNLENALQQSECFKLRATCG